MTDLSPRALVRARAATALDLLRQAIPAVKLEQTRATEVPEADLPHVAWYAPTESGTTDATSFVQLATAVPLLVHIRVRATRLDACEADLDQLVDLVKLAMLRDADVQRAPVQRITRVEVDTQVTAEGAAFLGQAVVTIGFEVAETIVPLGRDDLLTLAATIQPFGADGDTLTVTTTFPPT